MRYQLWIIWLYLLLVCGSYPVKLLLLRNSVISLKLCFVNIAGFNKIVAILLIPINCGKTGAKRLQDLVRIAHLNKIWHKLCILVALT